MKNKKSINWLIAIFVISSLAFTQGSYAQTRLPDGTVVYQDGTVRLPNGQVRYPNNTNGTTYPSNYPDYGVGRYPRTSTRQSDGSIIYPDGRIVYPDGTIRYPDGRVYSRSRNSRWIPPGQAKKMYGSKSAKQYAPGHNKNRDGDYEDDNDNHDKGWKNNKGHGKGKHGNGKHGHDD